MSNARLSEECAKQAIEAVNVALKAGHLPSGRPVSMGVVNSNRAAAVALGINISTLRSRISVAKEVYGLTPDVSLFKEPEVHYREVAPPSKPRVRVRMGETSRPDGASYRVLGVGDLHDHPLMPDKSRFRWIGKYAAEHRIPYIEQIGDWGTFDSCSQWEAYGSITGRDKPSFEMDINSLEESIGAFISSFPKDYRPRCFVTKGNHENRVAQWEDSNPEIEGLMAIKVDQAFARGRFDCCEYGEWDFIGGVGFTHVPMNIMGKPYGGKMSYNQIANDAMFSVVSGHTHKGHIISRPKIGPAMQITVLNLGCALPYGHVEPYAKLSTTGWTYGIYDITIQAGDIQSHRFISMLELEEKYG